MPTYSPPIVYGFHVCDREVAEQLVSGFEKPWLSRNEYDWLGEGMYFFESDPDRARLFGEAVRKEPKLSRGEIKIPAVIGAVIELKSCLDLTTVQGRHLLALAEKTLSNPSLQNRESSRKRDCAAITALHQLRQDAGSEPFGVVRAAFREGSPLYQSAVLHAADHLQIAVIDLRCIKGFFWAHTT